VAAITIANRIGGNANTDFGFVWSGQASGVVSNNTAQNNSTGFYLYDGASPELTGNTSNNNTSFGFAWDDQASSVGPTNIAQNNGYSDFYDRTSGQVDLRNNNEAVTPAPPAPTATAGYTEVACAQPYFISFDTSCGLLQAGIDVGCILDGTVPKCL
jgi:parallel beta-helix repeat protein